MTIRANEIPESNPLDPTPDRKLRVAEGQSEHYREAVRLIDESRETQVPGSVTLLLQAAQVHATLAQTPAIAMSLALAKGPKTLTDDR